MTAFNSAVNKLIKTRIFFYVHLFCLSCQGFGQLNLVPNYSFEDTSGCPVGFGDLKTKNWKNCSWSGTSDFFHTCGSPFYCGVPANQLGYQYPATGKAYGGIICYSKPTQPAPSSNYREYLFIKLTTTLTIGQTYYVQFKVSCNDDTLKDFSGSCINKLGARFLTVPIDSIPPQPRFPDNFAHVYTNNIITDRVNWAPICGIFTADSAYQYLVLGNFFDDEQTNAIYPNFPTFTGVHFAYYYLDDVFVSPFPMLCGTGVGTEEYNYSNILEIYPNPNNGFLKITSSNGNNIQTVTLHNSQGIDLRTFSSVNSNECVLDLSLYEPGVYGLKINVGDRSIYKRIVKY